MKTRLSETARLEVRMPVGVYALLKRSAALQGRTLTDFVISATSAAAREAIEEREILRLSATDQRYVADMILHPPPPSPALIRAAKRYRQHVDTV